VGTTQQPIVGSMLGYSSRRELGGAQEEKDAVGDEAWVRTGNMGGAGTGMDGASLESERGGAGLPKAGTPLHIAI